MRNARGNPARGAANKGWVLALGLSASLLVPVTAHAADPPAGKAPGVSRDEARADAEKRLSEGLDRYAKGDYEGARLAFAQAYAVLTSIDLLYNLMRAEVKSGHPLEALVHIHQMLRDPNATSEDHAKAQRLLDEANRVTGHIAVDAPAGAEIVVDDVPSGEAPVKEPFDVTPGKHKVEARAGANRPRVDVDAPAGEIVTARFAMDMKAPTVSAPVPIALPAPASPREPNEPVGATSPAPHAEEHAHEHVSSKARIVVPVVVGAVAVVALGVGIGMGVAAQGKESDATSFRQNNPQGFCSDRGSAACGQYKSLLDSQETDTSVSRAMFVTGGVLAAAAIVTFFVWPRDRREPGEVRSAWIAPTIGGVSAGGTF